MSHALSVSLTRQGSKIDLDTQSAALGVLHINGETLSPDERTGTAKKLLAASALCRYCAAPDNALDARSAKYDKIEASATLETGADDKGRGRVPAFAWTSPCSWIRSTSVFLSVWKKS